MRHDDTFAPRVFLICGLVIVGFVIYAIINAFGAKDVQFDAEGVTETFSVEGLALVPGEERTFTYTLKCKDSGRYGVGIEVKEKKDGGLKSFVNVVVRLDGEVILRGKLSDLMNTSETLLSDHTFGRESVELSVTYSMPESVGNEAMKTYSDFDMTLVLSEKGERSDG